MLILMLISPFHHWITVPVQLVYILTPNHKNETSTKRDSGAGAFL